MTRFGKCTKKKYRRYAQALAKLGDMVRMREQEGKIYRQETDIYLCERCDCWHLTHLRRART